MNHARTGLIGAALAFAVTNASAQGAPEDVAAGQGRGGVQSESTGQQRSGGGLEEIVVTAQRREQSLQDVPISVMALTAQTLERAGVLQTSDLQVVTPGLVWSTALSVPTPFVRGVGSRDNSSANESSVATYVDGIYYAGMPAGLLALPNIKRVEVLKGPQGTLFGRNATGGLIQIITLDPPSSLSGTLQVGYSNYDTITTSAYVGGPLTEILAADLSVYFTDQRDGWGRNLVSGTDVNRAKDLAARSKFVLSPGDATKVTLAFDYDDRRSDIGSALNILEGSFAADGRCSAAPFPAGYPGCSARAPSTFRGSIYDSQSDVYGTDGKNGAQKAGTEQRGASLTFEHDFNFATLRSLTSYRKLDADQYVAQEGSSIPIVSVLLHQYDRTGTQELQLAAPSDSNIQWIVGAFYMNRSAGYSPFHAFGYGLGLPSPLDPAGQYGAPPRFGGSFSVYSDVDISSYSGYIQATVEILPETNLTAGLRYTTDDQELVARQVDARGVQRSAADVQQSFSKPTYRLALDHRFNASLMTYVSFNRGFKAGLFNTTSADGSFANPETLDAYELGFKSDLLDRKLRIDVAAFHYEFDDIQLPVVVPGGTRTINAAQATIDGLDVDMILMPVPSLTLTAGGSFLFKAEYDSFPNGPLFVPGATGATQVARDLSGNRMIRSPKLSGNVGVDYRFEVGANELGANVTYYHNSGFGWTPDEVYRQPSYGLLNGQLSWASTSSGFGVKLWGRNLLREQYLNYVGPSSLGTVAGPAAPRTYGVTGEFKF